MQHELFTRPVPGPSLFFALVPAASDRMALDAALAEVAASGPALQALAPGKRHVTLLYLGQPPDEGLAPVAAAAQRAAATVHGAPFVLTLPQTALFGRNAVVLVASQVPPALAALETSLRVAVQRAGLPLERAGRFHPHLTLAYAEGARPRPAALAPVRLAFDAFVLLRGGSREAYQELGRWPLDAG